MKIDSIQNGVVIDHIPAGRAMKLYELLKLDELDAEVIIIKNASSGKFGKKDIIIIAAETALKLDVIGYVAPEATVSTIKNAATIEKRSMSLPEKLTNVIKCKNPSCITSCEQELDSVFKLTDRGNRIYRCIYCEARA